MNWPLLALGILTFLPFSLCRQGLAESPSGTDLLRREHVIAWCYVPFDAVERTPAERARMLADLGIRHAAYDWREKNVPDFEEEFKQYKEQGIELFAFWDEHEQAWPLFEKYDLSPQIWKIAPSPEGATQEARIQAATNQLKPLADRIQQLNKRSVLCLYNHGGWGGEPENLAAVCERLHHMGSTHVGIVYNFHHGHDHISDWPASFAMMKPYLRCLNVNGMNASGQPKILGVGKGEHELEMIKVALEGGYAGPFGILDHRPKLDAKESLLENLDGLESIRQKLAHDVSQPSSSSATHPEHEHHEHVHQEEVSAATPGTVLPYDPELVTRLSQLIPEEGDLARGAMVFANSKLACLQCHRIGELGGEVGPELISAVKDRSLAQIVEAVFWPQRDVKPEFISWTIVTTEGQILSGYKRETTGDGIELYDPTAKTTHHLRSDDIEEEAQRGSLMPEGLIASLTEQQQVDLIYFLSRIGETDEIKTVLIEAVFHQLGHQPVDFEMESTPLIPDDNPQWKEHVNRDRLYDFYAKQADHFRGTDPLPMLLSAFPGLDGGVFGHWGNQEDVDWADERRNKSDLGRVQSEIFRANGKTIPRAVCVRLGENGELSACFNPDTLTYDAFWSGGFVEIDSKRYGFLGGVKPAGKMLEPVPTTAPPTEPFEYHGFYRDGERVIFSYRIGETEYLDAPWVKNGEFVREVAPRDQHSLKHVIDGGASNWPQTIEKNIVFGTAQPYAIDTFELPFENPWGSLLFFAGHDFLPNGDALVCTMQGDVWKVSGLDSTPDNPLPVHWKRFATGLSQALGLVVTDEGIFVQGRDQITRLHDLNGDDEADFYERFSNAFETSSASHDYVFGLEQDESNHLYLVSSNQGVVRISPDGSRADVIATGLRNPDGIGLMGDGTVTFPSSEGEWVPASLIGALGPQQMNQSPPAHFGYLGPHDDQPPMLPLVYLPRGVDHSSGGQTFVDSDRWGPLKGQMLHFSFGAAKHFLILRDEVDGQAQGAVVPLPGDFRSGSHRGRFRPQDGQLYVSGMDGWGCYGLDDGSFQRVRYTGGPVQLPVDFHVYQNGVSVSFSNPIDRSIAENISQHFAQCWNYRYGPGYGSPEYSPSHFGTRGHDPLRIASAHVLEDGHTLFIELPDLQPVNQLHLNLKVDDSDRTQNLFVTVHKLDEPFEELPNYQPTAKIIAAHPILRDMATSIQMVPNPHIKRISPARHVKIETGKNLTYETRQFHAKPGEAIKLTLFNPDVVPHNWALIQDGTLHSVGEMANQLISDPTAVARNYIPESDDVLCYTNVVEPSGSFTIYFRAPEEPGHYPYLCTFPGHWMIMNGVMIVE